MSCVDAYPETVKS